MKKYLSVEPETLGANLILRRYLNRDFSRSKLNIKIRGGRIFGKLVTENVKTFMVGQKSTCTSSVFGGGYFCIHPHSF